MSIREIYTKEMEEARQKRNSPPGVNWRIMEAALLRKERDRERARARAKDKKKPAKKISQGTVHWLESELVKVK